MEDETESVITLFYKIVVYIHLEYFVLCPYSCLKKNL